MIWFTSDLHLMQRNIVKKISRWDHAWPTDLRDFEDEREMSQHIIDKINEYVKEDDELYILGNVNIFRLHHFLQFLFGFFHASHI